MSEPKVDNALTGVSTLTSVNEKTLNKLVDVLIYCITDAVSDSVIENEKLTVVDIGIGQIKVLQDEDKVKFAFVPCAKLRESIIKSIFNRENVLEEVVENTLKNKLINTYKELV